MPRPTNQMLERYYFEQFKSHYALPEGEITFTDKPDVVIRGTRAIGIEIANLYIVSGAEPSSEQVQRGRRLKMLKLAQQIFLRGGGKRIKLSVDFDPRFPIQDIESVAHALAGVAVEAELQPASQIKRKAFAHVPELRFVHYNPQEYEDAKWRPVQVYRVPDLSLARVRETTADKMEKLRDYQPCDAYWLLLVVDLMDRAQDQGIGWPAGEVLDRTPFERILLYKPQEGQVTVVPQ